MYDFELSVIGSYLMPFFPASFLLNRQEKILTMCLISKQIIEVKLCVNSSVNVKHLSLHFSGQIDWILFILSSKQLSNMSDLVTNSQAVQ